VHPCRSSFRGNKIQAELDRSTINLSRVAGRRASSGANGFPPRSTSREACLLLSSFPYDTRGVVNSVDPTTTKQAALCKTSRRDGGGGGTFVLSPSERQKNIQKS
jgi:hypothetical protein